MIVSVTFKWPMLLLKQISTIIVWLFLQINHNYIIIQNVQCILVARQRIKRYPQLATYLHKLYRHIFIYWSKKTKKIKKINNCAGARFTKKTYNNFYPKFLVK